MKTLRLFFFLFITHTIYSQKIVRLSSPNGQIQFSFHLNDSSPVYNVSFKNKLLINNSSLSLDFLETGEFGKSLKAANPIFRNGEEDYELIVGKAKTVHQNYHEAVIPLEEKNSPFRKVNFVIRAFDDGLAFRYEFPGQKNWSQFSLTDERSTFKLAGDPNVLALFLP